MVGIYWLDVLLEQGALERRAFLEHLQKEGGALRPGFAFQCAPEGRVLAVELDASNSLSTRTNLRLSSQTRDQNGFLPPEFLDADDPSPLVLVAMKGDVVDLLAEDATLWCYSGRDAEFSWEDPIPRSVQRRLGSPSPPAKAMMPPAVLAELETTGPSIALSGRIYDSWFGTPPQIKDVLEISPHAKLSVETARVHRNKPAVVQEWHDSFAQMAVHMRFHGACQPTCWREKDHYVFLQAEEQWCLAWAVAQGDLAKPDPPVFAKTDRETIVPFAASTSQYSVLFVLAWMLYSGGAGVHGVLREYKASLEDGLLDLNLPSVPWFLNDVIITGDRDAWVLLGDETCVLAPDDASFDRFLERRRLTRDDVALESFP
ncbi:MAG: hypothetical protein QM765_40430 [Myxococcales bacterium]